MHLFRFKRERKNVPALGPSVRSYHFALSFLLRYPSLTPFSNVIQPMSHYLQSTLLSSVSLSTNLSIYLRLNGYFVVQRRVIHDPKS